MKTIINTILFPFATTTSPVDDVFVKYVGNRPVAYKVTGGKWSIL